MNRKPIYHETNPRFRVISVPNGQWQAQRRLDVPSSNTVDPWANIGGPDPIDVAQARMQAAAETKKK